MAPRREELPGIIWRERVLRRLLSQVSPEERVVVKARTRDNHYLVLTSQRILMEGRFQRLEAIDLDRVTSLHEVPSAHRTTLVLVHDPLPRRRPLPNLLDIPQWIRRWRTGDRWRTETQLPFSQATGKAATAIRELLQARPGVTVGGPWQPPPWQ